MTGCFRDHFFADGRRARAPRAGRQPGRTARRLGISPTTLRAWRRAEGEVGAFVQVTVGDAPARSVAVLVSPTGWRPEADAAGEPLGQCYALL